MIRLLLRPTLNLLAGVFMSALLLFVAAGLVFAFGASVAPDLASVKDWASPLSEQTVATRYEGAPAPDEGRSVLGDPPPSTSGTARSRRLSR